MLKRDEPYQEHLGTLTDGIKFTQGKNAYAASGEFIGAVTLDGKLKIKPTGVKAKVEPQNVVADQVGLPVNSIDTTTGSAVDVAVEATVAPAVDVASTYELKDMSRDELLKYALKTYKVKLQGNLSAKVLREKISRLTTNVNLSIG